MAVRFDAANDAYSRAAVHATGSAVSIILWVYFVSNTGAETDLAIIGAGGAGDGGAVWLSNMPSGTTYRAFNADGSASIGAQVVATGTWYRMAVTRSGTAAAFYSGPEAGALTAASGTLSRAAADTLTLGSYYGINSNLNGRMAAVKVYNAQLTAAEVEVETRQYVPARTANIFGWYPWLGPDTTDYSGVGNNLTAGAGTPTVEDGPPIPWIRNGPPQPKTPRRRAANY